MRSILVVCLFFLFTTDSADADIFTYKDENGIVCYTDTPFDKKATRIVKDTAPHAALENNSETNDSTPTADFSTIVHEKAALYDLDPSLIKAVITTESNWNSRAISSKGAMGLMQLMPTTATDMRVHNPFDPEQNIEGGARYLKYLLERFHGDLTLALAAYNAGPTTVEKYGYTIPPINETQNYVRKVLSLYNGETNDTFPGSSSQNGKKAELIYKVVLEDGTVLFTNSALAAKNPVRF